MEKDRYFQFLRGILITLVILIHAMYENNNVYINCINIILRNVINFVVPMFIFISAYFAKKEKFNQRTYMKNRIKKLLIPLIMWSAFYSVVLFISNKNLGYKTVLKKFLTFTSAGHLYYLLVLLQLIIITPFLYKLLDNKKTKKILYLITPVYLIIVLVVNIICKTNVPYYQFYIFGWLLYYLIGLEKEKIKASKNYIRICIILLIGCFINVIIYLYNNKNYIYSVSQINITNMLYVCSLIPLIMYFDKRYKTNKVFNCFEKIGDNSFGIYFLHMFILKLMNITFKRVCLPFYISYFLMTFLTLIISFYSIKLFKIVTQGKFNKLLGF